MLQLSNLYLNLNKRYKKEISWVEQGNNSMTMSMLILEFCENKFILNFYCYCLQYKQIVFSFDIILSTSI
jgi:hypothetical protein